MNYKEWVIPVYEWDVRKIPRPTREFKFNDGRKWKNDYCWTNKKLVVEIEGGIFKYGRHNSPLGFIRDMEKYNKLTEQGYYLLRYLPKKVNYDQISRILSALPDLTDY